MTTSSTVTDQMTFQDASSSDSPETACCGGGSHVEAVPASIDEPAPTAARKDSKLIAALDMAGMTASTLCLIHCLAMPVVIALIPAFAAQLFESDWFHIVLAFMVLVFCLLAFIPGYTRHHDKRLIWIGIVGLSFVFFATFVARFWSETAEIGLVTVGNLVLVAGHLLNRKLTNKACCPGDEH
jgi:hypothetical protein